MTILSPQTRLFALVAGGLGLLFAWPLYEHIRLALDIDLHSHTLLVPFVSIYFAWLKKDELPKPTAPNKTLGILLAVIGIGLASIRCLGTGPESIEDRVVLSSLAFVSLCLAAAAFIFGANILRSQSFSLGFLIFFTPMPLFLQDWVNAFFQYTSAEVSYHMVRLADIPIFRGHPLTFQLPTIDLHVAPSCSGIRSSLVLLITSIVAGKLFLQSPWSRWALIVFIVPLAIVRNGFRIFTISYLCVHVGPHMHNHWIHHKGGPIFFILSLPPFFAFLYWLWKRERRPGRERAEAEGQ